MGDSVQQVRGVCCMMGDSVQQVRGVCCVMVDSVRQVRGVWHDGRQCATGYERGVA